MVTGTLSAGRPVSGGPLFCARPLFRNHSLFRNRPARLAALSLVVTAALGLSGCLIFSPDEDNDANSGSSSNDDTGSNSNIDSRTQPKAGLAIAAPNDTNTNTNTATPAPTAMLSDETSHRDHECVLRSATEAEVLGERVTIEAVTDGDTVVLSDRRKVRIIGINAAELSKNSERLLRQEAIDAKELVARLANEAEFLTLIPGEETKDRYGRTLAHLLQPNGRSLATELLTRGLAAATAVAPNTRCADHYHRLEGVARDQNRGLWRHPNNPWFAPGNDSEHPLDNRNVQGFHILVSKVVSVTPERTLWHVELSNGVIVYARMDLVDKDTANSWIDESVEVRGWFGRRNGRVSVNLHHPTNLSLQ